MILLVDNYDSFVYNLARYIAELGHEPVVYRNDAITLDDVIDLSPSHIILSPGPCTPLEAGICLDVVTHFLDKLPMLGVCLGHQAIAQACGGTLARAQKPMHGKSSKISHNADGIFEGLPNPCEVGRYHSLIVSDNGLPEDLIVTARSAENEIMALQHKLFPVFGVQFHPESVMTNYGHQMLKHFLSISPKTGKKNPASLSAVPGILCEGTF